MADGDDVAADGVRLAVGAGQAALLVVRLDSADLAAENDIITNMAASGGP